MVFHIIRRHEFTPSCIAEHTVNGSPKKRIRHAVNGSQDCKIQEADKKDGIFTENDETVATELTHRTELPGECLDSIENPTVKLDVVKAMNKKIPKKPFDFTKANQELLVEFPIARQPHKIYSLTQHNVEKFLRENDSKSSYSSQYHTTHKSTQDNLEGLPVYQRYAVTLDDIKNTKVPSKVKGHLANLLESMENYCNSPDDKKISNVEAANSIAVPSNRNFDSVASNVSDLSNLSSPSDNVDCIEGNVDPITESVNTDYQNDVKMCDGESHDDGDDHTCNNMGTDEENNQPLCINKSCQGEVQLNCITDNVKEIKDLGDNLVHSLKVSDGVRHDTPVGQLDDFDIKSPPVDILEDNCMNNDSIEGFQKVVSKRSKRRTSPKERQCNLKGIPGDETVWRLHGNNVIQASIVILTYTLSAGTRG